MNTLNNENPINNENPVNRPNLSNEATNLYNSKIPSLNDLSEKYQTGIMGTLVSLYFQLLNTFAKYGINKTFEFLIFKFFFNINLITCSETYLPISSFNLLPAKIISG